MEFNEVEAMSNAELRVKIALLTGATKINQDPDDENLLEAYWPERDEGRGEGWQEILDFPNDIAAAMDLALSISDKYWMELHTPFRIGDPFFAGFTPLNTSGWNGRPDNQCEAEKPGKAITRAYVLAVTEEA